MTFFALFSCRRILLFVSIVFYSSFTKQMFCRLPVVAVCVHPGSSLLGFSIGMDKTVEELSSELSCNLQGA